MRYVATVAAVVLLAAAAAVRADRGSIPYQDPSIDIEEPGQKAIIAWHEGREVLILATELRASRQTEVLEIMPLPADPVIKKGSDKSFEAVNTFFDEYEGLDRYSRTDRGDAPGITITQKKRIGPHDITAVKVTDAREVVTWLTSTIRTRGGDPRALGDSIEGIVRRYVDQGICYFVFDFVTLSEELTSVTPVVYAFDSPCPYYPVTITEITGGETAIQLVLITAQHPSDFPQHWYAFSRPWNAWKLASVTTENLRMIESSVHDLFKGHTGPVFLTAREQKGSPAELGDVSHKQFIRLAPIEHLPGGECLLRLAYAGIQPGDRLTLRGERRGSEKFNLLDFLEADSDKVVTTADIPLEDQFWLRPKTATFRLKRELLGTQCYVHLLRNQRIAAMTGALTYPHSRNARFEESPRLAVEMLLHSKGKTAVRAALRPGGEGPVFDVKRNTRFEIRIAWETSLQGIRDISSMGQAHVVGRGATAGAWNGPAAAAGTWRYEGQIFLGVTAGDQSFTLYFVTPDGTWYSERVTARIEE